MHALDARQAVADLVSNLAGLVLNCGVFLLALLLLASSCLRVALSVGRFLTRDPRQIPVAQDVLDVPPPHFASVADTQHDHAEHDQVGKERQEQPWIIEQEPHTGQLRV